jgi:hypothetical protein
MKNDAKETMMNMAPSRKQMKGVKNNAKKDDIIDLNINVKRKNKPKN